MANVTGRATRAPARSSMTEESPTGESEPGAAYGNEAIVLYQEGRRSGGGADELVAVYSSDGDGTWTDRTLPRPHCADPSLPYTGVTDPWVSFDGNGNAVPPDGATALISVSDKEVELDMSHE